ncbi:hypothetical protein CCMSSC00406_0010348 [Pleurotus cornucopiae]|uniref:Uncharacterized protein n=1 Tax=Pleurotus cornucopiae TaxID=5321 RepID=A0ACB7IGP5_PLECO|nr:hypothetical protein CCMSSC00406_0010348 [Pleurotus cornucopiae]
MPPIPVIVDLQLDHFCYFSIAQLWISFEDLQRNPDMVVSVRRVSLRLRVILASHCRQPYPHPLDIPLQRSHFVVIVVSQPSMSHLTVHHLFVASIPKIRALLCPNFTASPLRPSGVFCSRARVFVGSPPLAPSNARSPSSLDLQLLRHAALGRYITVDVLLSPLRCSPTSRVEAPFVIPCAIVPSADLVTALLAFGFKSDTLQLVTISHTTSALANVAVN